MHTRDDGSKVMKKRRRAWSRAARVLLPPPRASIGRLIFYSGRSWICIRSGPRSRSARLPSLVFSVWDAAGRICRRYNAGDTVEDQSCTADYPRILGRFVPFAHCSWFVQSCVMQTSRRCLNRVILTRFLRYERQGRILDSGTFADMVPGGRCGSRGEELASGGLFLIFYYQGLAENSECINERQ